MIKKLLRSFAMAWETIRTRFFHTLLSVLGIIIGVAALVATLSLIDGMEKFAREQIGDTTDLKSIMISSQPRKKVDDVWVRKEKFAYLQYEDFVDMQDKLSKPNSSMLIVRRNRELTWEENDKSLGANINASSVIDNPKLALSHGRLFNETDIDSLAEVAVLSYKFAIKMASQDSFPHLLGQHLLYQDKSLEVIGILDSIKGGGTQLFIPFSLINQQALALAPPIAVVEADDISDVPGLQEDIKSWAEQHYGDQHEDIQAVTNESRVKQVIQGFTLFRFVMGLIVGISILVGGIGIMNVLLISVSERTVEIGIRKAMGANKRDILYQFLTESLTVSALGSALGLILGILAAMIFSPIIDYFIEIPFQASYTLNTLIVIAVITLLVGIIFGTYPATRAAKLDPVEAIRRE